MTHLFGFLFGKDLTRILEFFLKFAMNNVIKFQERKRE